MASTAPKDRLAKYLESHRLTREAFARKARIKHSTMVTHYVLGTRRPGLDAALKIQKVTGIPAGEWIKAPAIPQGRRRAA